MKYPIWKRLRWSRIKCKSIRIYKWYKGCMMQIFKLKYNYGNNIIKLHVGSGSTYFRGWINIDLDYDEADMLMDIMKGLPFKDGSVGYIYHAHFIEHFTLHENLRIFKEFFRVLKTGGVLRILYPDIRKYCEIYLKRDIDTIQKLIKEDKISNNFEFDIVSEWFNRIFYWHKHKFGFDFDIIRIIAGKIGFRNTEIVSRGKSKHPDLQGIDYHPGTEKISTIVEITK